MKQSGCLHCGEKLTALAALLGAAGRCGGREVDGRAGAWAVVFAALVELGFARDDAVDFCMCVSRPSWVPLGMDRGFGGAYL